MYATPDISPFVQRSQDSTDFFLSMRNAYGAARRSLGYFVWGLFAVLVLPFAVAVVWTILRHQRNQLRKLLSTDVDLSDYKNTRIEYDRLNAIVDKTGDRDFGKIVDQAPWLFRGTLRIIFDILQLIRKRKDAIGHALSQLDDTAPVTDLLKPMPEAELWDCRTKAYDYRF